MDSRFQGMMTHMDQRLDAMQSSFDNNWDALNTEYSEFRSHIQNHVIDPIMNRLNDMQQSFRTTWELCLVNLTTSLPMTACMRSVRCSSNSNKTLASSPLFLIPSTLTITTCIRHQVISEASLLWQIDAKGGEK